MKRPMTYMHMWPILDDSLPMSVLRTEASAMLDVLARRAGARLVGDPTWWVAGDRLVVRAPAVPADPQADPITESVLILRLTQLGWSPAQIGEELGYPASDIDQALREMGVPAGQGVPEVDTPWPVGETA